MPNYVFYYDESQHSRLLNFKTVIADEFYDGFVVAIVGWDERRERDLAAKYSVFENKYLSPNAKELKSTVLKKSQFKYGFKTLSQNNARLISDFLDLFDEDIYVYCAFSSKAEWLIDKLFSQYQNSPRFNADSLKYSLAKLLVQYRPTKVVESLYRSPDDLITALRVFLRNRIKLDKTNLELKHTEIAQCQLILKVFDCVEPLENYEWEYYSPLSGFALYLSEHNEVDSYTLTIDREENTRAAAERLGFDGVCQADSTECFGIRMSDMLVGIVAKLMKAIRNEQTYQSQEDGLQKKLFDNEWFNLNDERLALYKKLRRVLIQYDQCWYKFYASGYSDDLVVLLSLLNYLSSFENASQLREVGENNTEHFNSLCCESLSEHFHVMDDDPIWVSNSSDSSNLFRPRLRITGQPRTYTVQGVMFAEDGAPMAVISDNGHETACLLPASLAKWAKDVLSCAALTDSFFPAKVAFQYYEGQFRADFLL